MHPDARHRIAEARFRELLADAGLGPPDRVEYAARSVVFFWEGPRVAVAIDFDDPVSVAAGAGERAADLR